MTKEPLTIEGLRAMMGMCDVLVDIAELVNARADTIVRGQAITQKLGSLYNTREQMKRILDEVPQDRVAGLMKALLDLGSLAKIDFDELLGPHRTEKMNQLRAVRDGLHAALDNWPKSGSEPKAGQPPYG